MSSLAIGSIVFICVFGGALLGISLRFILPEHHLSAESKDAVKVGIGLIATMAALVLGLLVATAKASYDTKSNELTEMSANTVMLDRMLAHYGPEAAPIRETLRRAGAHSLEMLWPQNGQAPRLEPAGGAEVLYDAIAGAFTEERCAARAPEPGAPPHDRYRQDALAAVRAIRQFDFHALSGRAGFLAHHYLHELRLVRAA